jgi:multicomponent Na+:H+ antiporter subunit B
MTSIMIDMFLLGLLVFIAVMILRTGKLFAVIVMSGGYSLTSAAIFVNLDAVDVAFTEAAVGAGISTVLFLAAMSFLPAEEKAASKSDSTFSRTLIASIVCVVAGGLLVFAALDLPAFGDPNAPAHLHVAPRYLEESGALLHIPNVVTTVLASYRGFDTLGETIVVFTAGLGVLMLLAGATRTRRPDASQSAAAQSMAPQSAAAPKKARGKAKKGAAK